MDILNLALGLQSIAHSMNVTMLALFSHQLVWGVAIGFALSTAIHALVVSRSPRSYYHMVTKSPNRAYEIIHGGSTSTISLEAFHRDHLHIRVLFYLTLLAFLAVMLIAIVRY